MMLARLGGFAIWLLAAGVFSRNAVSLLSLCDSMSLSFGLCLAISLYLSVSLSIYLSIYLALSLARPRQESWPLRTICKIKAHSLSV